jgi:hypothetical protein
MYMRQFCIAIVMMSLYCLLAGVGFLIVFLTTFLLIHLLADSLGFARGRMHTNWEMLIALLTGGVGYAIAVVSFVVRGHLQRSRRSIIGERSGK